MKKEQMSLQTIWHQGKSHWLKVLSLILGAFLINITLLLDIRLALIWVLGFLFLIQIAKPIFALILMIPVYFRGFGFFPRQYLGQVLGSLEPRDIAFAFLMSLTAAVCALSPRVLTRVRRSVLFFPILFLIGYVVLRIILTGLEVGEPILALRAGRRYFSYLLYFVVIAFVSDVRKGRQLINGLMFMGVVVALMNLAAQVIPDWFSYYFSATNSLSDLGAYSGALGVKLHVPGRFIMFLALIWCFFRWLQFRRSGNLVILLVLGAGFLVQKYRTFYIVLPISIFFTWYLARKPPREARRQLGLMVAVVLVAMIGFTCVLLASPRLREDVARFVWEAWASATGEISTGTFQDRLQRAAWRLELFKARPILGVGFIHDSLAPWLFNQESIGITWVGYADVLVTGGGLLVLAIGWVIIASWWFLLKGLRKRVLQSDVFWIVAGAMAFSIMATLGMVSWSLLTIDDGIVPLVLALGLAERFLALEAQNESDRPVLISPVTDRRSKLG